VPTWLGQAAGPRDGIYTNKTTIKVHKTAMFGVDPTHAWSRQMLKLFPTDLVNNLVSCLPCSSDAISTAIDSYLVCVVPPA
jgi:hypothetical protein